MDVSCSRPQAQCGFLTAYVWDIQGNRLARLLRKRVSLTILRNAYRMSVTARRRGRSVINLIEKLAEHGRTSLHFRALRSAIFQWSRWSEINRCFNTQKARFYQAQ